MGHLSQPKTWSNLGALILSTAFLYEAIKRGVAWDDWLGYSVALAFVLSPTLVGKFLGLRYGQSATIAPAPIQGGTQ